MTQGVNGRKFGAWLLSAAALVAVCGLPNMVVAQDKPDEKAEEKEKPEFKPWAEVSKGFEKVTSTADGKPSFYTLWTKNKDGSMLAELPRGYEGQRHFIALTIASGEEYAGLQFGEMYVYWKRIDNRMVLIEPTVDTRSTGDAESKSSVKNLFTDRVIIDVPIVTMGPSGQPVIDMKDLLVNQSRTFFGGSVNGVNTRIATIKKAKAFPENIEVAYEMPIAGGRLKEFHYSISLLREDPDYKPRHADERLGYFTTVYRDLGKFTDKEKWNRYINRWKLEKRDSKLAMSPPKEPIVFHIDAAVPVRYREAVRRGVLEWNKAFEKVGIVNAVEVYQQDETTGAHMDKDPEDVRYNFIRWLSNDQGTAIGPSRVHPLTGQILDADVVLTDGWIRHFWVQFNEIMPELMMDGMSAETLAWLELHPQWDPRVRLADPAQRPMILAQRARKGVTAYGGHPIALGDPDAAHDGPGAMLHGRTEYDGLVNRTSQINGLCLAAKGKAFDMATGRLTLEMLASDESFDALASADDGKGDAKDGKDEKDKKKRVPELDGIPDWFVQPLLADLVSHEVGHTLGLRHNFKASCQYTLGEINSDEVKGKKPFAGSVMDYIPVNFAVEKGKLTGDVAMTGIGDYDMWVIEYGYTLDDPKDVLKRVGQPGLDYGTDEDTGGVDPRARRYDFSKNPIDYARNQMELATYHRGRLLDKFVKDGDNWSRVRRGYEITLGMQARSLSIMSSWVGGVYINRDKKGDSTTRKPLEVVPASTQREALKWCIDNSFFEESFGLTPEISSKMITDKWLDQGGFGEAVQESTYPIHDRLGGIQASVMTMLLNPTTTRRIFDNEFLVGNDEAITLSEVLDTIDDAVWKELDKSPGGSVKKPYISSLRRGLQSEYVDRLVNLSMPGGALRGESGKAVSTLVTSKLRTISKKLEDIVGKDGTKKSGLDPYSYAHLSEAKLRIDKALDSQYIYNANEIGGGYGGFMFFGQPTESTPTNK